MSSEPVRLGAHFATPFASDGGWDAQLDIFQRGRFTAAKVMIPPGFGWQPGHVEELIDAGAREIVLRTEDDDYTPQRVRAELVDRGFYRLIERYGGVDFILEIGNEQNLARDSKGRARPMDPWLGRFWQLYTRHELRDLDRSNLRWVASMPTTVDQIEVYLQRTVEGWTGGKRIGLADVYDGFGAHLYGHFRLSYGGAEEGPGGASGWLDGIALLREHSDLPVYVTEFGINHVFDDPTEKARRYLEWLHTLDARLTPSAYVYWVGSGTRHPSYQVTAAMAGQLAVYGPEPVETQPLLTMTDAVRQLQGWAAAQDPDFVPIDFDEEDA